MKQTDFLQQTFHEQFAQRNGQRGGISVWTDGTSRAGMTAFKDLLQKIVALNADVEMERARGTRRLGCFDMN